MNAVRLKNGAEEADVFVDAMMRGIRTLMQDQPIAFYEFVLKCRGRQHEMFGSTAETVIDLQWMGENGSIHESIRNVVLSAVEGEGLDMVLVDPRAEPASVA